MVFLLNHCTISWKLVEVRLPTRGPEAQKLKLLRVKHNVQLFGLAIDAGKVLLQGLAITLAVHNAETSPGNISVHCGTPQIPYDRADTLPTVFTSLQKRTCS